MQVNGINVENATHEEVVHLLRNAGDEVTITVEYLRDAPSFLKLPLGSPGPASDHGSRACSPLFDSGLHLNGNPSSTAPSSPSSPVANEPKYEKHWIDTLSVPLSMARISRCKAGAEKLRSGAFEVLALDGVSTGILQFHTAQESTDWLRAVSANIGDLTLQTMRVANECCSPCDQVVHMGWVSERLEGTGSCHTFRPKFLALKGSSLHVFSIPPVSTLDWVQAEKTYNLCEVLFKLHKLWLSEDCWLHTDLGLGPHGFEDPQPYCFSVLVSHGQSRIFSVELGSELATWERSFQRATFMEVQRTGHSHKRPGGPGLCWEPLDDSCQASLHLSLQEAVGPSHGTHDHFSFKLLLGWTVSVLDSLVASQLNLIRSCTNFLEGSNSCHTNTSISVRLVAVTQTARVMRVILCLQTHMHTTNCSAPVGYARTQMPVWAGRKCAEPDPSVCEYFLSSCTRP
ncbi:gamma-2-syntrophin isoform X3 [Ursus arctos]|nr:gamma-2-syntrophin isoform X3 [Ursus arctos]